MFMAAPLSTNSRYMDPSSFLPCIDCNLPDNEEILLSPRSLFVLLFPLVSFLVCLNSFSIASDPRVVRISGGRFWVVPFWKFCVLVRHWAAKWPSFPHLWHFIWLLYTSGIHSRFPPTRSSGIRVFSATSARGNPSIPNLLLCASHDARSQRCHVNNCMHVLENLPD